MYIDWSGQKKTCSQILAELFEGNTRFASSLGEPYCVRQCAPASRLASPLDAVIFHCLDIFADPRAIFDIRDLNVVTLGTIGLAVDSSIVGSIEYCVENYGAKVIVALGHRGCDVMKDACSFSNSPSSSMDSILNSLCSEIESSPKSDIEAERVEIASSTLIAGSRLLQHLIGKSELTIVNAMFDSSTGNAAILPIDASGEELHAA